MLAKEDVLLWFKDLESYKRIEVMYELLNMCIPFEIRFLGTCIEEIGKHTYQELRGPSIIANDPERLAKDAALQAGLVDEGARHRAVIYMSVLSSRNCLCANWYYRTLLRPAETQEHVVNVLSGKEQDFSNVISELLLFYTLGVYHPAFTFNQKTHFKDALDALSRHCAATNGRNAAVAAAAVPPEPVGQVPVARNVSSHIEANQPLVVPVKTPSVVMPVEIIPVQPHAIPQSVPAKVPNFLFPSGPPEARPFPAQTNKHTPSAPPRRDWSPPPSPLLTPMAPLLDAVAAQAPSHLDLNLVPAGPPPISFVPPVEVIPKNIEEENHFISEEKRELPWPPNEQIAKQNGIRFIKNFYPSTHEQLANLKIDPDKPPMMLGSNSNSSCSSRNQSPTETPSVTPAVTPHGPGRGAPPPPQQQPQPPQPQPPDAKPRVNGLPLQPLRLIAPAAACDPPPYSTVTTFTNYQPTHPPTRYYAYRQPFPTFPTLPHTNELFYNYPTSVYYSSPVPPPPRNPTCCNCGGMGHTSVDCTSQSVEDITLTPYTLDFESPTVPDNPPEK